MSWKISNSVNKFLVLAVVLIGCVNLVQSGGGLFFNNHQSHPKRQTLVKFYFWENLQGRPKQVVLRKDKCLNVPSYDAARSIWASDCVMVYKKDWCWGEGVRIAGMVSEFRSQGLFQGVGSVKPCEHNIYVKFVTKPASKGWGK